MLRRALKAVVPVVLGFLLASWSPGVAAGEAAVGACKTNTAELFVQVMLLEPKAVHHDMVRKLLNSQRPRRLRMFDAAIKEAASDDAQTFSGFMSDATTAKDCVKIVYGEADQPVALPSGSSDEGSGEDAPVIEKAEGAYGIASTLKSIALAAWLPDWDSDLPRKDLKPRLRIIVAVSETTPPPDVSITQEPFPTDGSATCASREPTVKELLAQLAASDTRLVMLVRQKYHSAWEKALAAEPTAYPALAVGISTLTYSKDNAPVNEAVYFSHIAQGIAAATKQLACARFPEVTGARPDDRPVMNDSRTDESVAKKPLLQASTSRTATGRETAGLVLLASITGFALRP